ncbi:MAG: 50S ribosome-binding GTPase [Desulfobacterales bacterium]|nr:50S ribosome-binding GTPase [Desulfobacterales bacterium]
MSFTCGIVGLPNAGKSTLFNLVTRSSAPAENYPFCTIDPNIGIMNVPDGNLDAIARIIKPEKIIPTTLKLFDIAGLVKRGIQGRGPGQPVPGTDQGRGCRCSRGQMLRGCWRQPCIHRRGPGQGHGHHPHRARHGRPRTRAETAGVHQERHAPGTQGLCLQANPSSWRPWRERSQKVYASSTPISP